jgi:hypothetical protein
MAGRGMDGIIPGRMNYEINLVAGALASDGIH